MKFVEKFEKISEENNSLLCVGLDIDKEKIPKFLFDDYKDPYLEFNKKIIDSTKDIVCAYKLNMAFYEALGIEGIKTLHDTIKYIPKEIIIIVDGKRNDIGNTATKYAKSIFNALCADATTINPYLGFDSIDPFIKYKEKYNFILCRTSNPSAKELQDLIIQDKPLYQIVAERIEKWNQNKNLGAVVGATYPKELKKIREILGENSILLIPGIGKQGGDVKQTVKNSTNNNKKNIIINSSRGIIYSEKTYDFAEKSREKAKKLRDEINKYRR